MFNLKQYSKSENVEFTTLPSYALQKEIGKVCYRRLGNEHEVLFTFLWEQPLEGCMTGLALDASFSLRAKYGRSLEGEVPEKQLEAYWKKGWVKVEKRDGLERCYFKREFYEDAVKKGYLKYTENQIESLARRFITYLSDTLDASGKPHVIYWACGDGSEYEVLGSFSPDHWKTKEIIGPAMKDFGLTTNLLPALKYYESRFQEAAQSLFIIFTDGTINDLEAVKEYSTALARRIELGKRKPIKFVLVGIGTDVKEKQLQELDNLYTGTNVDLWDYKLAKDMRDLVEIFAEMADENQMVAPTAQIVDDTGKEVMFFSDGLPARVLFRMPATSKHFEIRIRDKVIRQWLVSTPALTEKPSVARKEEVKSVSVKVLAREHEEKEPDEIIADSTELEIQEPVAAVSRTDSTEIKRAPHKAFTKKTRQAKKK